MLAGRSGASAATSSRFDLMVGISLAGFNIYVVGGLACAFLKPMIPIHIPAERSALAALLLSSSNPSVFTTGMSISMSIANRAMLLSLRRRPRRKVQYKWSGIAASTRYQYVHAPKNPNMATQTESRCALTSSSICISPKGQNRAITGNVSLTSSRS
ncbi:hypothetical protein D9M68_100050 [compost metagenome]